ncbi:adenylate/guanylate cyclase domain-containing protein [Alphaproteobacteria bacterium]|nr:adenylate/guanylate cyclase domain-containing protein [Rhodobiaceae bacterium]MDA8524362.1 adenylate/guanylate cyclase domain-containing protein [Alphaproteobacteria bacterium]RPF94877.1 MAG: adenylate/guanylate cyclase domain-containing protein [Rhizobiales bacterium TMED162]MDA8624580.1 adenylate/guanylate cyclase domain-containing protein [Alphaproteobacteria bacterium]MDA8642970.1 adenylate/guanylate cyclase domain-containing protein [Alphaproteobacteria bacterium]
MSYLKRIGLPLQKFILPFIAPMAVLLTAVSLQLWQPYPIEFTRNLVFDQYNRWLPRHEQDSPVVFVDIDEASLARLGQFPWPRSVFADLVDKMTGYGSAAIAFDILFTEADRTAPAEILPVWENLRLSENAPEWQALRAAITAQITSPDDALARAMADAPVIMATMMSDEAARLAAPKAGIAVRAQGSSDTDGLDPMRNVPASSFAISNRDVLNDNALGLGSINARIDDDGIIRRASLLFRAGEHIYPSLALESLRVAQGAGSIVLRASDVRGEGSYSAGFGLSRLKVGRLIAPIEPDGSMRLYFAESADIQTVSAYEILQPDFDMTRLAGKIAFIGTSAAGLKDIRATPLNPATPGVEVHIQTVQQMLAGTYLTRPIWVQMAEALVTMLIGLGVVVMVYRFSLVPSIAFLGLALISGAALSWHQFSNHLVLIDPATPGLSIFLTFLTAAFLHFLETARERREVRNAFQYYLAPDMVEQVASDPDKLKLGGETRDLTILFCDIRGFTTISEAFADAPEKLTHIINIFLTGLSSVIQTRSGTIDKYIGDNIMAFWNAPTDVAQHGYQACRATLEMVDALVEVNETLRQDAFLGGFEQEIRIGIGLNSGATLVGNVGSDQRFNYSVMGDTVNVAARLEGQTKDYAQTILIGESTYADAMTAIDDGQPPMAFLELDLIALKGKALPQRIYALLGGAEMAESEDFQTLKAGQDAVLQAYRAQSWDVAEKTARALCATHPALGDYYEMLIGRINAYRNNPPEADWTGQFIAQTK